MIKVLLGRPQQYRNRELLNVLSEFRKGRRTRDQIDNIHWIIEKTREFQKNICFTDYTNIFDCVDHNKLWKILQEMGITDHLTCLLRNLYVGQEATVRTRYGTKDWFKIGKGICQGCILSPCLFVYMLSTSCEMPGWMKHKLESRFPGKIQSSQICRWYYPNCRKQRGIEEPLDESERGEQKKLA